MRLGHCKQCFSQSSCSSIKSVNTCECCVVDMRQECKIFHLNPCIVKWLLLAVRFHKLSRNVLIVRRSSSGEAPSTAQPQHRIVQEPASDSTICTNDLIQLSSQCAIQCFSSSSRSAVLFYLLFGLLPQRNKNHSSLEDLTFNLPSKVTYKWILSDTTWLYWQYTVPTDVHCFTNNYLVLYSIDIPCLQLPSLKKHRISPLVNGQAR